MKQPNYLLDGTRMLFEFILFLLFMASAVAVIVCVAGSVLAVFGGVRMLPGFSVAFPLTIAACAFVIGASAGGLLLKLSQQ